MKAVVMLNKLLKVRRITVAEFLLMNNALIACYDEIQSLQIDVILDPVF